MAGIVARTYGEALSELAQESGREDRFKKELWELEELLASNVDLNLFLKHPKIGKEAKKEVLIKIMNDADPYLKNFVQLLIDKSRFSHFNDIVKVFVKRYNELRHIEVAYVQSASQLSQEELNALRSMLEKHSGKSVEMKVSVHKELIAGLRIKIKDEVLDNSAARRLEKMKETVMKTTL